MTHYATVVILPHTERPTDEEAHRAVEHLMRPYQETDEWFGDGTRWDWYSIGNRWDGEMLGLDRVEVTETCDICHGMGTRPGGLEQFGADWFLSTNGCNGCNGKGVRSAWSSDEWETFDRNMGQMHEIRRDFTPSAAIAPDGRWYENGRPGWFGTTIPDENGRVDKTGPFSELWGDLRRQYATHYAVLVDCHV